MHLRLRWAEVERVLARQADELKELCVSRGAEVSLLSREVAFLRSRLSPGEEEKDELCDDLDSTTRSRGAPLETGDQEKSRRKGEGEVLTLCKNEGIEDELARGSENIAVMREQLQAAKREAALMNAQLAVAEESGRNE